LSSVPFSSEPGVKLVGRVIGEVFTASSPVLQWVLLLEGTGRSVNGVKTFADCGIQSMPHPITVRRVRSGGNRHRHGDSSLALGQLDGLTPRVGSLFMHPPDALKSGARLFHRIIRHRRCRMSRDDCLLASPCFQLKKSTWGVGGAGDVRAKSRARPPQVYRMTSR
jgi:hypothetical protein